MVSPVRALAYDFDRKILALGYRGYASIWQRAVGKHSTQEWQAIDVFRTIIDGVPAKVNSLHFFGPHKGLFLGLDSGAMIWSVGGRLAMVDMGSQVH
ncbi:hypothetical protein FRC08_010339 [Ceratobasidium sp. 394]|nr:hypothetical protein FRC08_010339 [Ceratobasidium sp. 394]